MAEMDRAELGRLRDLFTTVLLPYDLLPLLEGYERAIRQRDHARAWATHWRTMAFGPPEGITEPPDDLTGDDDDGWAP